MNIDSENIIDLILDDDSRKKLLRAIASEKGNSPDISNAISNAIYNLEPIDESEIIRIKDILLNEGDIGEDILSNFIPRKNFPAQLLYELLDRDKCLMALCHRRQPIDFLLQLIEKYDDCQEAIITIGQYYYRSENISVSQFINHVDRYKHSSWLLSKLLHLSDSENPKTQHFLDFITTTESGLELIQKYRDRELEKELETTTDIELIREKAATKNPKFLRAIARNDCTSIELLTELSSMREAKYARQIRINALETLRKKKPFPN